MASGQGVPPATAKSGAISRRWSFGSARLDEASLELTVDGHAVELERKPLEVLLHLLHHAGEVVTKEELIASVWPGRILSDSVLTTCVAKVRDVLGDGRQLLIRTVHGYGYRLVAEIKVEAVTGSAPPRFDFKPGDHPLHRPQWSLVERLGSGGSGEAWLARQDKTLATRVYKFALDARHLVSLKREITLYRLLRSALGEEAPVVQVLDWNLDEAPYYLELEHVRDGSLVDWASAQGGIGNVPLQTRLEIAAQTAEALAAAHSMGVLHKDLKPSNVLIAAGADGKIRIQLADFGSGGVLDPGRLEAMGITRLGFTRTIADPGTSGTPVYFAPEVIAGQPFTVQADIYALGVLLYQLVAGDLRRTFAPGWERDIADELLREDIAAAAEGQPNRRLADAALVAQRIRSLERRRAERQRERDSQALAERSRRAREELKRLRAVTVALLVLALAATLAGMLAYRARNEADAARLDAERSSATARAVSDFMNGELLGGMRWNEQAEPESVQSLLDRAAVQVQQRLAAQPEAAAEIHAVLGARYWEAWQIEKARAQFEQAVALYERSLGKEADPTLVALDWLLNASTMLRRPESAGLGQELIRRREHRNGPGHLLTLGARGDVAQAYVRSADYSRAILEYRELADLVRKSEPLTPLELAQTRKLAGMSSQPDPKQAMMARLQLALGEVLTTTADFREAENLLRESVGAVPSPADSVLGWGARISLARNLAAQGKLSEAEGLLNELSQVRAQWSENKAWLSGPWAELRLEQHRPADAIRHIRESITFCERFKFNCALIPDDRVRWARGLAIAYRESGRLSEAISEFRNVISYKAQGPERDSPWTLLSYVELADALLQSGRVQEASAALQAATPALLEQLPDRSHVLGELRRVEGLLSLEAGRHDEAKVALAQALQITEYRYGPGHWRTRRVREDLARAARTQ